MPKQSKAVRGTLILPISTTKWSTKWLKCSRCVCVRLLLLLLTYQRSPMPVNDRAKKEKERRSRTERTTTRRTNEEDVDELNPIGSLTGADADDG